MALFPCEIHMARYKGPSSSAYPALLTGGVSQRRKVRACEPCLSGRLGESPVTLTLIDPEHPEQLLGANGHGCVDHTDVQATAAFFLTAYRRGQEEESYYAPVCDDCAASLCEEWGLE